MADSDSKLFIAGFSHHRTPLELREQLALGPEECDLVRTEFATRCGTPEPLVLATCNRLEIYGTGNGTDPRTVLAEIVARTKGVKTEAIAPLLYQYFNHEMLLHLFSVASGIDSQMIGETEILGQLKESHRSAKQQGLCPSIDLAFQKSFQAAKWARTHTGISQGQISVGNVAAELALRIFGSLRAARVLILGSGEVATRTAQSLRDRGCRDLTVAGRNSATVTEIADKLGAATLAFDQFPKHLSLFDIVIGSTAAAQPVLGSTTLEKALKDRDLPLFLLDLAVPRDIDPAAAKLGDVFLYNLDDLSRLANENLEARRAEIDRCREELKRRAWSVWLRLYRGEARRKLEETLPRSA